MGLFSFQKTCVMIDTGRNLRVRIMGLGLKNRMAVEVTAVSNTFIDTYMAAANGEYVKVFLYLLRHAQEELTIPKIADALNHTESDVKRALSYWEDAGLLLWEDTEPLSREEPSMQTSSAQSPTMQGESDPGVLRQGRQETAPPQQEQSVTVPDAGDSYERLSRLSGDKEFSDLLYAVQQLLGKTFNNTECERFAYFYDVLEMSADLLEYLVEYCAENNHRSIYYIEKVALNWYQMEIRSREEAKSYVAQYSPYMSAILKTFGLSNRTLATVEQEYVKRWFKEYGFDIELVKEACSRTIKATGSASFPYADKILSGWKKAGVRSLKDVEELDKKRQISRPGGTDRTREPIKKSTGTNRFKNFEERSYNYEDYVWEGMRKRQKEGGEDHGAQ